MYSVLRHVDSATEGTNFDALLRPWPKNLSEFESYEAIRSKFSHQTGKEPHLETGFNLSTSLFPLSAIWNGDHSLKC
jgi:hypothetical protein